MTFFLSKSMSRDSFSSTLTQKLTQEERFSHPVDVVSWYKNPLRIAEHAIFALMDSQEAPLESLSVEVPIARGLGCDDPKARISLQEYLAYANPILLSNKKSEDTDELVFSHVFPGIEIDAAMQELLTIRHRRFSLNPEEAAALTERLSIYTWSMHPATWKRFIESVRHTAAVILHHGIFQGSPGLYSALAADISQNGNFKKCPAYPEFLNALYTIEGAEKGYSELSELRRKAREKQLEGLTSKIEGDAEKMLPILQVLGYEYRQRYLLDKLEQRL